MALLGLVAVAGYQNRGKLSEMLKSAQGGAAGAGPLGGLTGGQSSQGGMGGLLGELGGMLGIGGTGAGTGAGALGGQQSGSLTGGLSDLVDRFRTAGMGQKADSWVGSGENQRVEPQELEQALGPDMVADLQQKTGLSRDELLSRLSQALPDTVNRFTPQGRMPTDDEAREFY